MFFGIFGKKERDQTNDKTESQPTDIEAITVEEATKEDKTKEQNTKRSDYRKCPMPGCESLLVYPSERWQMNDTDWKVTLLCPNCFVKRVVVVGREDLRTMLKRGRVGREMIMKQHDAMQKRHMEEETDKFISALQGDHILPDDFIPPKQTSGKRSSRTS